MRASRLSVIPLPHQIRRRKSELQDLFEAGNDRFLLTTFESFVPGAGCIVRIDRGSCSADRGHFHYPLPPFLPRKETLEPDANSGDESSVASDSQSQFVGATKTPVVHVESPITTACIRPIHPEYGLL